MTHSTYKKNNNITRTDRCTDYITLRREIICQMLTTQVAQQWAVAKKEWLESGQTTNCGRTIDFYYPGMTMNK
jgi:hypothetical protein